jgi:hypothetical protein
MPGTLAPATCALQGQGGSARFRGKYPVVCESPANPNPHRLKAMAMRINIGFDPGSSTPYPGFCLLAMRGLMLLVLLAGAAGSVTFDQMGGLPYTVSYDDRAMLINAFIAPQWRDPLPPRPPRHATAHTWHAQG